MQEILAAAHTSILASLDSQMSADLTTLCEADAILRELSQALERASRRGVGRYTLNNSIRQGQMGTCRTTQHGARQYGLPWHSEADEDGHL